MLVVVLNTASSGLSRLNGLVALQQRAVLVKGKDISIGAAFGRAECDMNKLWCLQPVFCAAAAAAAAAAVGTAARLTWLCGICRSGRPPQLPAA